MNPVPLFLIIVTLPLFLGGCGEKITVEPVGEVKTVEENQQEVKPVEEKQQEVKEEVKPEEAVVETKPKPEGVNAEEIERREGIMYLKGSDTPYTGTRIRYVNGRKEAEANFRDGKRDGLLAFWYENGQKMRELNWKDGKKVEGSEKFWSYKGEPVDFEEE